MALTCPCIPSFISMGRKICRVTLALLVWLKKSSISDLAPEVQGDGGGKFRPHGGGQLQLLCQVGGALLQVIHPLDALEQLVGAVLTLGCLHLLVLKDLPGLEVVVEGVLPLLRLLLRHLGGKGWKMKKAKR